MKFLVVPPIILVPFHSAVIFSATGRASALNPAPTRAEVAKEREDAGMLSRWWESLGEDMVVVWCEDGECVERKARKKEGKGWPELGKWGLLKYYRRSGFVHHVQYRGFIFIPLRSHTHGSTLGLRRS